MTWNSTMSSGYSSLEEDSEEYFFTARTSFFKKPSGKVTESKVRRARPVRARASQSHAVWVLKGVMRNLIESLGGQSSFHYDKHMEETDQKLV